MKKPERARKPPRHPLIRVHLRPALAQWEGDEGITLAEAVALFFPDGPLTIKSLRAAAKKGQLAVKRIAGRDFTTPDAMREMLKPHLRVPPSRDATGRPAVQTAPIDTQRPAQRSAAHESVLETVRELNETMRERDRQDRAKAKAERDKPR